MDICQKISFIGGEIFFPFFCVFTKDQLFAKKSDFLLSCQDSFFAAANPTNLMPLAEWLVGWFEVSAEPVRIPA